MAFVNTGISLHVGNSQTGYNVSGTVRVRLSGTGPVGSAIWLVARLVYGDGTEAQGSRVLCSFVSLNSVNQGAPHQASVPISISSNVPSGATVSLQICPFTDHGATVSDYGIYNDSNGYCSLLAYKAS